MKNYRFLVPILLVILMFVSTYSMISNSIEQANELKNYIKQAKTCASQGLYDQAASYYSDAIAMDDNVEYYLAVIDIYYEAQQYDSSEEWCKVAVDTFRDDIRVYERKLRNSIKLQKYSDAFETLEKCDGKKFESKTIEKYREQMQFMYKEQYLSFEDVRQTSGGYITFCVKDKWGLANDKGSIKVSAKFKEIGYFSGDVVPVLDFAGTWYFMNQEGEYTINISNDIKGKITNVGMCVDNIFPVNKDGKYVYYNLDTKKEFGSYDYAGSFNSGVAAVKEGEKWFLINTSGEHINKTGYLDIIVDDRGVCCTQERIFAKTSEDGYYMLNSKGKQVGNELFDDAKLFASDEPAAVLVGELWGFVNTEGKIVVEPKYDDAKSFSKKLAPYKDDDTWGFIDIDEKQVIKPMYVDATSFNSSGVSFVKTENSCEALKLYKYN